jgi:hypothetical protein
MILNADSSEFAVLVDCWLAGVSTPEQAEQLWFCVGQCPACARKYAAAARFEELLAQTVKARHVESETRRVLTVVQKTDATEKTKPSKRVRFQSPWLSLAALFVVVGIMTALLWPEGQREGKNLAQVGIPAAAGRETQSKKQFSLSEPLSVPPRIGVPLSKVEPVSEMPLTGRLDAFFLSEVNLVHVPLSQALAYLQKQLLDLHDPQSLDLTSLKIHVPAGGNARPVSFVSGPIPFVKAVRALAALAGCDVELNGNAIFLKMQSGIYPHLAENRTLTDILAGRVSQDGLALVDDSRRIAELWQDAASLGIAVHENGTASVSRGQWEALRMMSDTRDQVAMLPVPSFAIYLMPASTPVEARLLTPDEVTNFTQTVAEQNQQPVLTVKPTLASPGNLEPLVIQPVGEQFNLALNPKLQPQALSDSPLTLASPMQTNLFSFTSPTARPSNQPAAAAAMIPASDLRMSGPNSDTLNATMMLGGAAFIVPITDPAP